VLKGERFYEAMARQALGADLTKDLDRQLDRERQALEEIFTAKHRRLLATTALLKGTLLALQARGWSTHAKLWNIGIHINLAAHDLSILVWKLCTEREIWARKLVARQVALMSYETTEDLAGLLGKEIRETLSALGVLDRYDAKLRAVRKPLDVFRKEHSKQLNSIRNLAAAHRGQEGLRMLTTIDEIDVEEILSLGLKLGGIINDIGPVLQEIFQETSELPEPNWTQTDAAS